MEIAKRNLCWLGNTPTSEITKRRYPFCFVTSEEGWHSLLSLLFVVLLCFLCFLDALWWMVSVNACSSFVPRRSMVGVGASVPPLTPDAGVESGTNALLIFLLAWELCL